MEVESSYQTVRKFRDAIYGNIAGTTEKERQILVKIAPTKLSTGSQELPLN
jgi:hypothetical protein